jgi:hypothetical protein
VAAAAQQRELEVLPDREMRVERVALEDHRDVAVAGRDVVDHPTADRDGAGGDLLEARDHAERGALAAAGRPHEHHERAVGDREVDRVDRLHPAGVDLRDLGEQDVRHRAEG